jgi:feruloyl-CoA synthase
LRAAFIDHCAPYAQDVVIAGIDREYISALVFPDVDACRALAGAPTATMAELAAHPRVCEIMRERLTSFARQGTGSSNRIRRLTVLCDPPNIDKSEMTDKGSINQRAVLSNRAALVASLYEKAPGAHVLSAD